MPLQDLDRTFASSPKGLRSPSREELGNVLGAYVKRNPTVGYCQGMNFLVAHMLRYMEEEEAFWLLCLLVESILPLDYYSIMTGVVVDQKLFRKLLRMLLPSLWDRLDRASLDPSLVTMEWFVCLFSHNISPDVSCPHWSLGRRSHLGQRACAGVQDGPEGGAELLLALAEEPDALW